MRIPIGSFWDSLRFNRKRELFEVCENGKLFTLGLKDASLLLDNYHQECNAEIVALNGTNEELLAAWALLIERQKRNNGSPENVEREYQYKLNSSNKLKYARLEIMLFEWGNCMNQFVYYHEDYMRIEEEFQKLFTTVIREDYED